MSPNSKNNEKYPIDSINPNLIKDRDDVVEIRLKSIWLFFIKKEYQTRGLGRENFKKVITEMELNWNKSVWVGLGSN